MTLTAGHAAVVITPPVGTMMEGYTANTEGSFGVHDDLHARAIVIDDGSTAVALVSCDLIGVDRRLVAQARDIAHDTTGVPREHMLVAGTHTHQGPAGLRSRGDEALMDVVARQVAGVIATAHRALRPAVLKAGTTTVDSVSQNRRHPDWARDTSMHVLLLDDPDPLQPPVAALTNFACHPTVLYHDNRLLSADYPGHAVRVVEDVFPGIGGAFFNGACGNVNPNWIEQVHAEAERVGKVVGSASARLIAELRPLGRGQKAHNIRWDEHLDWPVTAGELVENVRLRVASARVDLPIRTYLPQEEYEATLKELQSRVDTASDREQHRALMAQVTRFRTEREAGRRLAGREGTTAHPEVQAIGFTRDLALLGLPGEFFVETIDDIRAKAGIARLPVACYANHYVGYVVPPAAFDEGGYEAGVSILGAEAEGIVKTAAISMLGEVAG